MVQNKIWYIEISRQFTGLTDGTVVLLIWIVLVPLRIQTKGFMHEPITAFGITKAVLIKRFVPGTGEFLSVFKAHCKAVLLSLGR